MLGLHDLVAAAMALVTSMLPDNSQTFKSAKCLGPTCVKDYLLEYDPACLLRAMDRTSVYPYNIRHFLSRTSHSFQERDTWSHSNGDLTRHFILEF